MPQTALAQRAEDRLFGSMLEDTTQLDIPRWIEAESRYRRAWLQEPSVLIYLPPRNGLGGWVFETEEALPFAAIVGGSWEDTSNLDAAFPSNVPISQVTFDLHSQHTEYKLRNGGSYEGIFESFEEVTEACKRHPQRKSGRLQVVEHKITRYTFRSNV